MFAILGYNMFAILGYNMFAILTQVLKTNQWQLRSSLRQPMGVEACCI
jgi:hypothetical protein